MLYDEGGGGGQLCFTIKYSGMEILVKKKRSVMFGTIQKSEHTIIKKKTLKYDLTFSVFLSCFTRMDRLSFRAFTMSEGLL